jgi:hypothetical protein
MCLPGSTPLKRLRLLFGLSFAFSASFRAKRHPAFRSGAARCRRASFFRVGVFWLTGGVVPQSIFADARFIKCPGIFWYSMVG